MNFSWLLPSIEGIPILMYHKIWPNQNDALTIDPKKLRNHWYALKEAGYTAIDIYRFLDIVKTGRYSPKNKYILITFDDGYVNNATYAIPLLKELEWCSTFFIIGAVLDNTYKEVDSAKENNKLDVTALQNIDSNIIQLGMHGYRHEHFGRLSKNELNEVLEKSKTAFESYGLVHNNIVAYPYGDRPKDANQLNEMYTCLKKHNIQAAFRIGNKPCVIPSENIYELKRIDITGYDDSKTLLTKIRKGKLKPF